MNSNEQAKAIVDMWYTKYGAKASASDRRALVDEIAKAIDAVHTTTKTQCIRIVRHEFFCDGQDDAVRRIVDAIEALS